MVTNKNFNNKTSEDFKIVYNFLVEVDSNTNKKKGEISKRNQLNIHYKFNPKKYDLIRKY